MFRKKSAQIIGALAAVGAIGASTAWCAHNETNTAFDEGVVMSSCAPYDGAALMAMVPLSSTNTVALIHINEPLGPNPMSRDITGLSKPGGAAMNICQKLADNPKYPGVPQVGYDHCVDSVSGSIDLGALSNQRVTGRIDVKLKDGRSLVGDFRTKLLDFGPQRCG